jgi:hypothetical protein
MLVGVDVASPHWDAREAFVALHQPWRHADLVVASDSTPDSR